MSSAKAKTEELVQQTNSDLMGRNDVDGIINTLSKSGTHGLASEAQPR